MNGQVQQNQGAASPLPPAFTGAAVGTTSDRQAVTTCNQGGSFFDRVGAANGNVPGCVAAMRIASFPCTKDGVVNRGGLSESIVESFASNHDRLSADGFLIDQCVANVVEDGVEFSLKIYFAKDETTATGRRIVVSSLRVPK